MGVGTITLSQHGSVTEPSPLRLTWPSAAGKTVRDHGRFSVIGLPGGRGCLLANGMDPLYEVIDGSIYRLGLLAPNAAMVATPSGARATATLDLDVSADGAYNPSNGDAIVLNHYLRFVSSLSSWPIVNEILIGANASATLDNLQDYLKNTAGTKGSTWNAPTWNYIDLSKYYTVTSKTSTAITVRYDTWGAIGNSRAAYLYSGSWTDCSLGSQGGTVGSYGTFTGGSDATGSAPAAGAYDYYYGYHRTADGATSGVSPVVHESHGAAMNVGLSSMADPQDDDDIDFKRWWRTQSDGRVIYFGRDIADSGSTDTDDIANTTLALHTTYDATIHRLWQGGHIERVRYLAGYRGRWVGAGFVGGSVFKQGTVAVTNGSRAITFSAHPTKELEHWTFRRVGGGDDAALAYEIVAVDEDNQKAYLTEEWEGTTASGISFTVEDTREKNTLFYCEPYLPNQTSSSMNLTDVLGQDGEGITGLYEAFGSVIVFTRTGIWRFSGSDPATFRVDHEYEGVGCESHHSIVLVDGILYWLGSDGIYGWNGAGDPFKVSNPPTGQGQEPRGITRTIARINRMHAHGVVAHADPVERVVRWYVPLDDDITNRHAITLDLQTGAWGLETAEDVTYAATVTDLAGNQRTLLGDIHGQVWEAGVSTTDGAYGFEPTQAVVSGTTNTITVANVLPTSGDGAKGVPVLIWYSGGTYARARIASNTGTVATLTTYLDTAPSSSDHVIFGGIMAELETGWFTGSAPMLRKIFEALKVAFAYQSAGTFWLAVTTDQGTLAVLDPGGGDLTKTDGYEHFWVRESGKRLKFRLFGMQPGFDLVFQGLQMWLRVRDG